MIEMTDANEKLGEDIIFFLGAGASVDAGIPDTYQFVEDFKRIIKKKDSGLSEQLLRILEIREGFNEINFGAKEKEVDVEQLLETLSRLANKDKDVLLDFYEEKLLNKGLKQDAQVFQKLRRLLEDFIREKVVVEEEKELEYLKELLKFKTPLEIFSVNYDTCIEQLSHINHMRYTDGFDTYWDKSNFSKDFDIKHYKMHGSVIWYENKKTKEIVKIPVHAFIDEKPVELRLIFGEDVEPLLIYPAQKMEYVEPLTELQLMFKERVVKKGTKILTVVGYSFRDDYIIHMLWDAGRVNEDLHIVLVNPNAQKYFEEKLRFVGKRGKHPSRICNRVVCLPYPFSTVIDRLKNYYLRKLLNLIRIEKQFLKEERSGSKPDWWSLLKLSIECEFSTKTENILKEKIGWSEIHFDLPQTRAVYSVKALLHSVITRDGFEDEWLNRTKESLEVFSVENLEVHNVDDKGFMLKFSVGPDVCSFDSAIERWIDPILKEIQNKQVLLSAKFERNLSRIQKSLKRLEEFREYLDGLQGKIDWDRYLDSVMESDKIIVRIERFLQSSKTNRHEKLRDLVLEIERERLTTVLGGKTFQFRLHG